MKKLVVILVALLALPVASMADVVFTESFETDVLADGTTLDAAAPCGSAPFAIPTGWHSRGDDGYECGDNIVDVWNPVGDGTGDFVGGVPDGDNVLALGGTAIDDYEEVDINVPLTLVVGTVYTLTVDIALDTTAGSIDNIFAGPTLATGIVDGGGARWAGDYVGVWIEGWVPDIFPPDGPGQWVTYTVSRTITQADIDEGYDSIYIALVDNNAAGGNASYFDNVILSDDNVTAVDEWEMY